MFRRKELGLLEAGKPVAVIAMQLSIAAQTVHHCLNQHQVDRGARPGISPAESAELTAGRERSGA